MKKIIIQVIFVSVFTMVTGCATGDDFVPTPAKPIMVVHNESQKSSSQSDTGPVVNSSVPPIESMTQKQAVTNEVENQVTPQPATPAVARKVALVVQNHAASDADIPFMALTDALTAKLSGRVLRVVNPYNSIGVNLNRSAAGETMPEVSAMEMARNLKADGAVTASVVEFIDSASGTSHQYSIRIVLNLADAWSGATVVEGEVVEKSSPYYTNELVAWKKSKILNDLMYSAADECVARLKKNPNLLRWNPDAVKMLNVFFGCNVLGADIQVDGQSYGTCPAQIALTPGLHSLLVSYPPYYYEFKRRAMFNQDGQTYKVVLQLTPDGEAQRNRGLEYEMKFVELKKAQAELEKTRNDNAIDYEKKKLSLEKERKSIEAEQGERCELFKKQLELADAMLERYELSGEADDYVRKTIADGTSVYWKNSFGRIAITEGSADNIEFATPSTDAGDLAVPPNPKDIGEGLQKLLMKRIGR